MSRSAIWRAARGRPEAPSQCLLAQQPRSRLRRQGSGYWPPLRAVAGPLSSGASLVHLLRRRDRHANSPAEIPHTTGPTFAKPEKREHEYIRSPRYPRASRLVRGSPLARSCGTSGVTRTSVSTCHPISTTSPTRFADYRRFHSRVLDNLNTHWSLEVCELLALAKRRTFPQTKPAHSAAQRSTFLTDPDHDHIFHFTPIHGSWLNQVELWFSTLARRWLKRGDFASPEDFVARFASLLWTNTTPIGHIPIAGHSRTTLERTPRRSAKRDASNASAEHASVPVHNHSNAASTRRAPIVVVRLTNCSQSYEMAI